MSDGTTNDDVTITAGSGITLDPVAAGGLTISAPALMRQVQFVNGPASDVSATTTLNQWVTIISLSTIKIIEDLGYLF